MARNGIGGFTMRKKNLPVILSVLVIGIFILTTTSCKRNKEGEPEVIPNAGFRIALSGTANPSTLYVPETQPPVYSLITVRALHSNGSPAVGFDVIFQGGSWGYLEDFKTSFVRTTDASGIVQATYFLPPGVNVKAAGMTNVTVTLVDDGRLDNPMAVVEDVIPIRIIPYMTQGIVIHGRITTPAGNGVEGVTVELLGGDVALTSAATVTRPSGNYEFFVEAGWYGMITPSSAGYTFLPTSYTFDQTNPIISDIDNLDFVAIFAGGDTLTVDITQLPVPIEGDTQVINVYNSTGDTPIDYFVVSDSNWVHVSPSTGSTPGSFTITVDENPTGATRSGNVTVTATSTVATNVTISINQEGGQVPSDARLAADLETLNLGWESNSVIIQVFNSTTADSISYRVTNIPENDWIAVSATSGSTPSTLTVTVLDNIGEARTGQVILTPTSIGVSNTVTITVNQEAGPSLALDIETRNVAVGGDVFTVSVTNPTNGESVPFIVTSNNPPMIGAGGLQPTSGNTPAGISIIVNPNATGLIRTAVVTFTGAIPNVPAAQQPTVTLTVTQQGS
jgi:hypothetical protein